MGRCGRAFNSFPECPMTANPRQTTTALQYSLRPLRNFLRFMERLPLSLLEAYIAALIIDRLSQKKAGPIWKPLPRKRTSEEAY